MNFIYKKFFSIILLAACDAIYKFILLDIGAKGRESDGGVFAKSDIRLAIDNGSLKIPWDRTFRDYKDDQYFPDVFVADEA